METFKLRMKYLFTSTKGLILFAIAITTLVTIVWGTLSNPVAQTGIGDWVSRVLGMRLVPAEREGRIIVLYHSIAMAVIAIEVYMVTDLFKIHRIWRLIINITMTLGYLGTVVFGLFFAYFIWHHAFHGMYLTGLFLTFMVGLMLLVALWPWAKSARQVDPDYSRTRSGIDLERTAVFATVLTALISSIFGAVPAMEIGKSFNFFLAEDVIRLPEKTLLQYSIIGHLHIMLALIAILLTLIVGRWLGFKGILHKIAMPLMILGTIVLNIGVWGVVTPFQPIAHTIIYVGATPAMFAALLLLIWNWNNQIRTGTDGIAKPSFGQKLRALFRDPLKFGASWQMLFMNLSTSGLGIFMAVKLDEIFRQWPAREERIELTGHWHALSAIIATIILLYYGDILGLKGRARKIYGWGLIIFSDLALASVTALEMKRLWISEAEQQPLVNVLNTLIDTGLGVVMLVLTVVVVYRVVDFFKKRGTWRSEVDDRLQDEIGA